MTNQISFWETKKVSIYSLRMIKEKEVEYNAVLNKPITSPELVHELAKKLEYHEQAEEIFSIITLSTKNNVTGIFEVSRGSLNASIVHPREVFKRALISNANAIILIHNHPSGDTNPSREDILTTKRLVEAGELIGIKVLDHIIIGHDKFNSLKQTEHM